ncbi:MAG: hypoxanthine phosphoribosyltransferase [Chlorobi bacterium]|nr:hypoxanthine phosphoribosyltransferase [Chlorobiota bacterium]
MDNDRISTPLSDHGSVKLSDRVSAQIAEVISVNGRTFKLFLDRARIDSIVSELADRINRDYAGKQIVFLIVLKGSIFFSADLLRKITGDCRVETIRAKSYGSEMKSSCNVELDMTCSDVSGKHVIIIEDIVDSGRTLKKVSQKLKEQNPASLEIVSFLSKPTERVTDVDVKYVGMEIPNRFVIGYGLDFAECGRQYPDIYALHEE